jgi:hypothetical protein
VPEAPAPAPSRAQLLVRWLKAFGAFWWDFLVGDTPELLGGVLVTIGLVAVLVKASSLNAAAVAVFPAGVVLLLGGSVYHARRAKH